MKNTADSYGWLSITLHWFVAVAVIGLFFLGYWMVDLSYYDPWYNKAPDIHKSIGIVLFVIMVIRLGWKLSQIQPNPLSNYNKFERVVSHIVHLVLYLLIFVSMISGYLISTADGRGIEVFQLFSVPSIGELFANQEDLAGFVHEYIAYTIAFLVCTHIFAAFKHHLIDKDITLKRMFGRS